MMIALVALGIACLAVLVAIATSLEVHRLSETLERIQDRAFEAAARDTLAQAYGRERSTQHFNHLTNQNLS